MRLILLQPKESHCLLAEQIAAQGVLVILGLTPETAIFGVDYLRQVPAVIDLANATLCSMVDDGGDLFSWNQEMVRRELFESTRALEELANKNLRAILVPESELRTGDGATALPILIEQELPLIRLERQLELVAPPDNRSHGVFWWLDCRFPWSVETLEATTEMLRSEERH